MTRIRAATHTVGCIDAYCSYYRSVFHNVRHFEQFTQLELGMLAETKRKSLPRLAKTVQGDHQALHHFLANADWSVEELRTIRLQLTREALAGRPFVLCIDETGDRKQGHTTDYTASQYLGGLHRVEQGIVSVTLMRSHIAELVSRGIAGTVVTGTLRDSLFVLDGLLEQDATLLQPWQSLQPTVSGSGRRALLAI